MMRLFIFLFTVVILSACKQSRMIPENFDYGKTENGVYRNGYFNFEILIPDQWVVQNKEQMKQIKEEGRKMIEEHNKELASQVRANEVSSAMLLSVFKYNIDSVTGGYNPSIAIVAENLATISDINTGADYLDHAKTLMQKSGAEYTFSKGYRSQTIGTQKFDIMDLSIHIRGEDVQQSYFSTIEKGFALTVIISYSSDKEKGELEEVVKDMKFR